MRRQPKLRRALALLLTLVMLLGMLPTTAMAAEVTGSTPVNTVSGPVSLPDSGAQSGLLTDGSESGTAVEPEEELTKLEPSSDRFTDKLTDTGYAAGDRVTFIVVVEEQSLMDLYTTEEIAQQTAAVQRSEAASQKKLDKVKDKAVKALGEDCELGFDYTWPPPPSP